MLFLVKEALSISNVTHPTSTAHLAANFIINQQLLFEIVCFGMEDSSQQVQQHAADICTYILQVRLSMNT